MDSLFKRIVTDKTLDQTVFDALFLKQRPPAQQVKIYRYFVHQWAMAEASNKAVNPLYKDLAKFSMLRLQYCGDVAKVAVPDLLLIARQKGGETELRHQALSAILGIAPSEPQLDFLLIPSLAEDGASNPIRQVLDNIATRKSLWKQAIPALVAFVEKQPQTEETLHAYEVLGKVASASFTFTAEEARSKISSIDSIPMEEGAAAFVLLIRSKDASATSRDLLLDTLAHQKKRTIVRSALLTLLQLGLVSQPAVLKTLLDRMGAIEANQKLDTYNQDVWRDIDLVITNGVNPNTPQALSVLVTALQSPHFVVRQTAALALRAMKQTAAPAVPALVTALQKTMKRKDYGGVISCSLAISEIGPAALHSRTAILNMMAPHSPYLNTEYGADEFRSYWLAMITSIGIPQAEKERQLVLSQVMAGLRSKEPLDISGAALAAVQMPSERKQLLPLLLNVLKAGEKAGGLMPGPSQKNLYSAQRIWQWEEETFQAFENIIKAIGVLGHGSKDAIVILQRYNRMSKTAPLEPLKPQIQKTLSRLQK